MEHSATILRKEPFYMPQKFSWSALQGVYQSLSLQKEIERLERSYSSHDETKFFAKLVNTSLSRHQQYHRWVRYREGYAGDLVKEILRRFPNISKNHYIMDPMCGSGSTNVACCELGINSIGLDVNPYATLATEVKSYVLDKNDLSSLQTISKKIITEAKKSSCKLNEYEEEISKYFDSKKIRDLVQIKRVVSKIKNEKIKKILWLCLLSILEDCSNRKKDGNGLATRPSPIDCVYKRFESQILIVLDDYTNHPYKKPSKVLAIDADARFLRKSTVKSKKIGAIIFSPPYANSFDYFESYKLEIVFGEYSLLSKLNEFRSRLIRNYRIGQGSEKKSDVPIVGELCNEIWNRIPLKEKRTGTKDGRTRLVPNMLCSYFFDMREVIRGCYSLLEKNGYMHIVVDQSAYVGIPVPTDTILAAIAEKEGFKVQEMIVCRGANTSGQQLKEYPFLKDLLRETIVVLKKV